MLPTISSVEGITNTVYKLLYSRVEQFLKNKMDTRHVVPNCLKTTIPKSHIKFGLINMEALQCYSQPDFEFRARSDIIAPPPLSLSSRLVFTVSKV